MFVLIERAVEFRNPGKPLNIAPGSESTTFKRWVWVYCTSIGELTVAAPVVRALLEERRFGVLVLSNHPHYAKSYLAQFPGAVFGSSDGQAGAVRQLARAYPPECLLISEIPCIPSDAPCRFSYAYVRKMRVSRRQVIVLNAWLYGDKPVARLDKLERRWFGAWFVKSVNQCFVPSTELATKLRGIGYLREQLTETGSMKFDVIQEHADFKDLVPACRAWVDQARLASGAILVVAGSLKTDREVALVVDAYRLLRDGGRPIKLVIAPRHPENESFIELVIGVLESRQVSFARRSACADTQPIGADVLLLDSIGELRRFYSGATHAFVGTDHNVLEPLAERVSVAVTGKWNASYPTITVYNRARELDLLEHVDSAESLATTWTRPHAPVDIERGLAASLGATNRVMAYLQSEGLLQDVTSMASSATDNHLSDML